MARYANIDDLPAWCPKNDSRELLKALEHASTTANGYLAARYTMPLASWGADLRHHIAILAGYDVLSDSGFNPDAEGNKNIRDRYDDAIEWLKGVAAGTVQPPDIVDSTPPAAGQGEEGPFVLYPELSEDGQSLGVTAEPRPRGFGR